MNPPSRDIAALLQAAGIGTFATDIFVAVEPAAPDACLTVYDTSGASAWPDVTMYESTFQLRARSPSYPDAYAKLAAARDALILPTTVVVNSARYVGIWLVNEPGSLGRDDNNRHRLVANFRLLRQPST